MLRYRHARNESNDEDFRIKSRSYFQPRQNLPRRRTRLVTMRSNCLKLPSSCLLGAPPCPLASRPPGDAQATCGPRGRWR